jgi:uncharacterized protein (DUF433 family)
MIERNPDIANGFPHITGSRIPVTVILTHLADGYSQSGILFDYLNLDYSDITAALRYAVELVNNLPPLVQTEEIEPGTFVVTEPRYR